ncbi:MAG TPA: class I SAM-dependent methyltransferase [Trebonia sp.]|jgi:ubiquinone/menaquinone biosynthesis C-methylase UbiE
MGAVYDEIADWYEYEFLGSQDLRAADPLGIDRCLRALLGTGGGTCLEIGCGTGVHAATVRELGWTPTGVDISLGMLRHARERLAIVRGDAQRLPFRDESVPAVISVMAHTDMPGYLGVVSEAARVLRPGGALVHVGVHPCFCGGFADWTDRQAIVIRPGYGDTHWTKESWTDKGVRNRVGATHFPLPRLLHAFTEAGLILELFAEGGTPTPMVLGLRARKPSAPAAR